MEMSLMTPWNDQKCWENIFFCPCSHILGRMTKTNQPRKKPKETQNTPRRVQKCPEKSQNGMPMSLTYRKRRNIIFCSSSHITEPMTKNNSKEPKLHQGSRCVYIYTLPPHLVWWRTSEASESSERCPSSAARGAGAPGYVTSPEGAPSERSERADDR